MIAQGFVRNYSGLMATRVFLGLTEGGYFPGANFYITQFYRRDECGTRMASWFAAASLAGAFGGVIARGIAEMDGLGGLGAWRWIFIIEGLLSLVVSAVVFAVLQDFPQNEPKFLTAAENAEVLRRLREDSGENIEESEGFEKRFLFEALSDWKIWAHMGIYLAVFCSLYSLSLFSPTIIRGMNLREILRAKILLTLRNPWKAWDLPRTVLS